VYSYILNHSEAIQLKNTDAGSQPVTRTVIITYIDTNGNESESVTTSLSDVLYRGFVINGEVADSAQINGTAVGFAKHNIRFTCR
jgi:hypothetical protein